MHYRPMHFQQSFLSTRPKTALIHRARPRITAPLLLALSCLAAGCGGPKAVRGEDVEGLDTDAMSTGLDRRDLQKLKAENMNALDGSAVVSRWESEARPQLAVLPFRNETSEHIESSLDALISDIETDLINGGHVSVISLENQASLMAEIKRQQGEGFDQGKAAAVGRQLGVKYIITGKVFTTDEKLAKERRVQYYLFMQVLEVETGQILFQNKASLTKAMM
jgi:penicillin-binding protein activator